MENQKDFFKAKEIEKRNRQTNRTQKRIWNYLKIIWIFVLQTGQMSMNQQLVWWNVFLNNLRLNLVKARPGILFDQRYLFDLIKVLWEFNLEFLILLLYHSCVEILIKKKKTSFSIIFSTILSGRTKTETESDVHCHWVQSQSLGTSQVELWSTD